MLVAAALAGIGGLYAATFATKDTRKVPRGTIRSTAPMFWGYSETWTAGINTYNRADQPPVEAYAATLDALILAFNDFTFSADNSGNVLINGINGGSSNSDPTSGVNASTRCRFADRRRLLQDAQTECTNGAYGTETFLSDPYDGAAALTSYIQSVKDAATAAGNANAQVWVSMGGQSGSGGTFFADMDVTKVAAATERYQIDGWDLDYEDQQASPTMTFNKIQALSAALRAVTLTNGKKPTLCLCIQAGQTVTNRQGQFATLWTNNPGSYVDYVSIQCYNSCWPTDVRVDVQNLIAMGFHPAQIVLGINPGADECAVPSYVTQLSDVASYAAYVKAQGLGGMFVWSIQRDTATPNVIWAEPDNSSSVPSSNTWIPFGTAFPNGPWGPPWPAPAGVAPAATYEDGAFATAISGAL